MKEAVWFVVIFSGRLVYVRRACALVVTAAKKILHCTQMYVFVTVPRLTRADSYFIRPTSHVATRMHNYLFKVCFTQNSIFFLNAMHGSVEQNGE